MTALASSSGADRLGPNAQDANKESHTMALKHGSDHYTKWMHMENGQVMVRRIHRLEIQDAKGRLHMITRDRLPEAIVTSTGDAKKSPHIARILLRPQSVSLMDWQSLDLIPATFLWNALVFGFGFSTALMLRYAARMLVNF
jgi:hypothetical protein